MMGWLKGFGAFWYDFIVGDDWRVAVGVAAGLAATWAADRAGLAAWWVMPVVIVLLLPFSLWRAVAATKR